MKGNKNIEKTNKKDTKNTSKSFNITGVEKKKKVSTKGKKNWRKNIDVTEFDKKALKKLDQKIIEVNAKNMKDEDFFTLDVKPIETARQKLLREKSEKKKKVKKLSIFEERKIKRMIKNKQSQNLKIRVEPLAENKKQEQEKVYDLWGNQKESKESILKFPNSSVNLKKYIAYPKIPLPHPGQSYNPAEKDVKHLLDKVVEINKHLIKKFEPEQEKDIQPVKLYESSDSEEEDEEEINFQVSNNPAVDDTERKTRKERKRLIQKKLNLIKEKEKILKKQKKKEISSSIGLKRHEKQQKKFLKEKEEKLLKEMQEKKEKEKLIKLGLIDEYLKFIYYIFCLLLIKLFLKFFIFLIKKNFSKELLEEFVANPEPIPLRKLKTNNNLISDRFANIIKRNIIGDLKSKAKKRNRKLDKIHYKDNNNNDYEIFIEDDSSKLKIFE